ncbi:hypothetical protein [Muriicola sp.]|uniref:hypothetical protein n=1 Tax=Muriicola sp. TaxID=2020856 RepID=UPI003C71CB8B
MKKIYILSVMTLFGSFINLNAQESEPQEALSAKELAMKLNNPVSSLISVPFQNSTDIGIGEFEGTRNTLNFQPVVPMSLTKDINLITRVILPIVTQQNISAPGQVDTGLGDAVVSMFLNPAVSKGGFTWGVGPVFLVPTSTNDYLATKKFGVGPTAVALYQTGGSTYGSLINQIWSVSGNEDTPDVNQLYFQPFYGYNWDSGAGINLDMEIIHSWESGNTTAWIIPTISSVASLGSQKVQFLVGPRISLKQPNGAEAKFGVRAQLVFLFPR